MGNAVGQMLASAVGIAISPVPLIAVVLMLATPRGRGNGSAFALGWVAALALVTSLIVAFGGGMRTGGEPARWTDWLKLALGVLFLLLAAQQWRGRPREGQEAQVPGWMRTIDGFTPGKAAGLAVALVVANPKNLVLLVGGAVSIASSGASSEGKTLGVVLMVVIASLCVTLPLAVFLFGGDRAEGILAGWKTWMGAHNSAIMIVLLLVLGAKYVGDALTGLSG
ncbi:threonine/homoserine/homoserine lactone efflux protein [Streptacidiphilus sp. MAP12-33]|uniref:GAP family protein n=1 Tax=Streptacidiphilus sp. MAP12-33 TaxID=3156266 RepID=UPI0035138FA4